MPRMPQQPWRSWRRRARTALVRLTRSARRRVAWQAATCPSSRSGDSARRQIARGTSSVTAMSVQRNKVASPVRSSAAENSMAVAKLIASGDLNPYRARKSVARSIACSLTSNTATRSAANSARSGREVCGSLPHRLRATFEWRQPRSDQLRKRSRLRSRCSTTARHSGCPSKRSMKQQASR